MNATHPHYAHHRSWMRRWFSPMLPFVLLAAVAMPAMADDEDDSEGATFARVRYLDGDLTIEQMSEGEVVEGTINSPVVAGDRVSTTAGRAEIELADSTMMWMDGDTWLEVRTLADVQNRYQRTNLLALLQGSIRVEAPDPGDPDAVFQIDTEAGSIYLLSAGTFRIDAGGGSTTLSSYGGVAEFSGDGGSVLVRSAQRSSVQTGFSPSNPRRFNTQRLDDFDRFCVDRTDVFLRQGTDAGYDEALPEEIRPYAPELSFYGVWHTLPTYGRVWRPHYAGVWSPYHHGYWSRWRRNWVWVSYDPWGWAPYHYGRWDFAPDIGWFWVPGAVWSGAWVSFAVGPSYIGWCPLNYWNVPVFHDVWIVNRTTVNVARLDARGWRFVPAGRFGYRGAEAVALRGDRLPRNTDLVVTQRLPQFDPRVIAKQPERAAGLVEAARRARVAPPVSHEAGGTLSSFRAIERRAPRAPLGHPDVARPRARPLPDPAPSARRPQARPPRTNPGAAAPSRDRTAKPSQDAPPESPNGKPERDNDRGRGRAMERLFEGARTKAPAGSAPPPPGRVNSSRTSEPPEASSPQPPKPPRATTHPRRPRDKKPAPPDPPPPEDSPKPQGKRR